VPEGENAALTYEPDAAVEDTREFAALLAAARPRDALLKSTTRGPHRDDIEFTLNGRPARLYASEGQQRCMVVALRLAQAAYFRAKGGVTPVLLCDDVLGELDPVRRVRFWASLREDAQVIATGTTPPGPADGEWQVLQVVDGRVC
jgi:DNA replication and repair protein RecF